MIFLMCCFQGVHSIQGDTPKKQGRIRDRIQKSNQNDISGRVDRLENIMMKNKEKKKETIEYIGPHNRQPNVMGSGTDKEITANFRSMDRMVGYLCCGIHGRQTKLQNSGTQVANIFAELQRRCIIRGGKPLTFAIRIRDF